MNKTLFTLTFFTLFVTSGLSQINIIDELSLPDLETSIEFYANIDVAEEVKVYYSLHASDTGQEVMAELTPKDVEQFISSIEKTRFLYDKWSQVVNQEKYTRLVKRMHTSFQRQKIYFSKGGKWYCQKGVNMHSKFYVDASGKCYLIIYSDYMTSSETVAESFGFELTSVRGFMGFSNSISRITKQIYCSGSSIMLGSVEEINLFIDKLRAIVKWKEDNVEAGRHIRRVQQ